jgi:hypothetical protein
MVALPASPQVTEERCNLVPVENPALQAVRMALELRDAIASVPLYLMMISPMASVTL